MSQPQSASTQVLNLPELLEQILLRVPTLKLFVLQRVNSTFKDTIARSKLLRTKMLLESPPAKTLEAFLSLPRIKKATAPFSFNFLSDHIDAYPSNGWILGHERKEHDQLFSKPRRPGSWQNVKLGTSGGTRAVGLDLGPRRSMPNVMQLSGDATVGDLIAAAEKLVWDAWKAGLQRRSHCVSAERPSWLWYGDGPPPRPRY